MHRKQTEQIKKDLQKKMVFVVGPRQVGKTWLAKEIAKDYKNALYLNYDNSIHRDILKKQSWTDDVDLIIFDEIHKMPEWKNYIKGVFDTRAENTHMLITGSARLNAHKQAGDSLAGRFFTHRLMPFSLAELKGTSYENDIHRLLQRSGYPEPFLADDIETVDKWRDIYADTLLRKDVLDFTDVDNWLAMRQVFEILQNRVGSPVSYNNIAGDVGISPMTVKRYIEIFEELYLVFIVRPYSKKISRALSKTPKVYFYDHGFVRDDAAKLENFVAISLLKSLLAEHDKTGKKKRLSYLRTKDGKEVDFAIVNCENDLEVLLEVKTGDGNVSKQLKFFAEKYKVPSVQLVQNLKIEQKAGDFVELRKMLNYLNRLFL